MESEAPKKTWSVGTLTYTSTGLIFLFCWLLAGDFAWSMKERGVGNTATLMIKTFEVSDLLYSLLIISFPNATNVILGPIVSYLSDRHIGRFGRRIPYLIFTTPFIVVGLLGLAFTPQLGHMLIEALGPGKMSVHTAGLLVFAIFWILLDFGTTLANVIFVALVNDVVPAKLLGRFFGLFRAISLGAGILFNLYLLGHAEQYYMPIFAGLAILYGLGFTLMCVKVKEGKYPELPPNAGGAGKAVMTYFRDSFSIPYYRWVILAYVVGSLAALPLNAYTIFYAKSLNLNMDVLGKYLALTYVLSFFLSYPLGMLADKFHPVRTSMIAIFGYFLFSVAGTFCVTGHTSFAVIFVLHGVISGCFGTLSSSYAQRLFPRALFAQFNSAMMMMLSLGFTIVAPAIGLMLDWSGKRYHYVFYASALIALVGIGLFYSVWRRYQALGGEQNYQPPMPESLVTTKES